MGEVSLKGVIDMHIHTNPDIKTRAYDDFELMEAGIRVGARALVIKTHQGTTMDRAYLCNRHNAAVNGQKNDFTMYGSITLNKVVGGLNPNAVEVALKLGAKVVWLPTHSAENHIRQNKQLTWGCVEVTRAGKIVPELHDILGLVRDHNATLGTGHITPAESFLVAEAARKAGVEKIVVTHPEWWLIGMCLEDQIKIVKDYNVILELCYAQNRGDNSHIINSAMNCEAVKAIGYKNVMLSTDGGQVENPNWEVAMKEYMQYFVDHGIPEEHVSYMTRTVPAGLLGLAA